MSGQENESEPPVALNSHSTHQVVFFIDKAKYTTESHSLTPREILTVFAKEDPNETVLVRILGKKSEKLLDLDTEIEIKNGMHFTVLHQGPTTVS